MKFLNYDNTHLLTVGIFFISDWCERTQFPGEKPHLGNNIRECSITTNNQIGLTNIHKQIPKNNIGHIFASNIDPHRPNSLQPIKSQALEMIYSMFSCSQQFKQT